MEGKQLEIHPHIRGRDVVSDIALGLSDGLVTNLAFLTGFAGASSNITILRIAGVAAVLAGTVSMFFGGLLKARSEKELYQADSRREMQEIEAEPDEEKEELVDFYIKKGLSREQSVEVVEKITENKQEWLKDMLLHELHLHKDQLKSPYRVASVIGLGFLVGSLVPFLPYLVLQSKEQAIEVSVFISLFFVSVAGGWKGKLTGRIAKSALETTAVAALASGILYLIGRLLAFV
ncbi:MAG: VIT1/CCC1 transporter family protein [Conexivisphaerales archaeon]